MNDIKRAIFEHIGQEIDCKPEYSSISEFTIYRKGHRHIKIWVTQSAHIAIKTRCPDRIEIFDLTNSESIPEIIKIAKEQLTLPQSLGNTTRIPDIINPT